MINLHWQQATVSFMIFYFRRNFCNNNNNMFPLWSTANERKKTHTSNVLLSYVHCRSLLRFDRELEAMHLTHHWNEIWKETDKILCLEISKWTFFLSQFLFPQYILLFRCIAQQNAMPIKENWKCIHFFHIFFSVHFLYFSFFFANTEN